MSPETITKKIAELRALRSHVSRWKLGIPVAIIAVICCYIFSLYSSAASLAKPGKNRDKFVEVVKENIDARIIPIIKRTAIQTFRETKEAAQKEFEKLSARTPEFANALRAEVEILIKNVPDRAEIELAAILATALAKQDSKIAQLFPNATEDTIVNIIDKLMTMGKEQAAHISAKLFEPHLLSINNIIDDLNVIRESESIRPGDSIASGEMALLILDILRSEIE